MLGNLTDEEKALYYKDTEAKKITIHFPNGEHADITNSNILAESLSLTQILCNESQLKFGLCNSAQFEISLAAIVANIKGCWIEVSITTPSNNKSIPLGKYKVTEVEKTAGKSYKKITALDAMQALNVDITEWFNARTFPITIKNLRTQLMTKVGLTQENTTLLFDSMTIKNVLVSGNTLTALELMQYICELNGCFGRISQDTYKFKYVKLGYAPLLPSEKLYPEETLYPSEGYNITDLSSLGILRKAPLIEDYMTEPIEGIIIQNDNQAAVMTDKRNNPYMLDNNLLTLGKTDAELKTIANNLSNMLYGITYRPSEIESRGLPFLECGDFVAFEVGTDTVETYIFQRNLTGIQALKDKYTSEGEEYFTNDVNSLTQAVETLNRTVGQVQVDMAATEQGLDLKVSKDSVVAAINMTPETTTINAKKINLNGVVTANNYFKINTDGSMEAVNCKLSGDLTVVGNLKMKSTNGAVFNLVVNYEGSGSEDHYIDLRDFSGNVILRIDPNNATVTKNSDYRWQSSSLSPL